MTIRINHIGFDVINGGSIHQVGTLHINHGAQIGVILYTVNAHTRKAEMIGTEGRACGKDAHATIAAQSWRPYCERRALRVGRKFPYEPQIVKAFDAAQGLHMTVGRFENNAAREAFDKTALTRNAKFRLQR